MEPDSEEKPQVLFTHDLIRRFKFEYGDQFLSSTASQCDFCGISLPLTTETQRKCQLCPVIYDTCEDCDTQVEICHRDHREPYDSEAKYQQLVEHLQQQTRLPEIRMFFMNYAQRHGLDRNYQKIAEDSEPELIETHYLDISDINRLKKSSYREEDQEVFDQVIRSRKMGANVIYKVYDCYNTLTCEEVDILAIHAKMKVAQDLKKDLKTGLSSMYLIKNIASQLDTSVPFEKYLQRVILEDNFVLSQLTLILSKVVRDQLS